MKYILILSFVLLFSACKSNTKQVAEGDSALVSVIDLSQNVSKVESLPISDAVSKIDIVPLEVTERSMLGGIDKLQVTQDDIWIKTYRNECIYRFSRSGKFLNNVGKVGQGPEEYIDLHDFILNEKQKEVYIISSVSGVKVYDFDGNYKRRITNLKVDDMINAHKEQFVFHLNSVFLSQNLCIQKPIASPKDSLWSIALLDSTFCKKKIFKNPVHIGKEEVLVEHRTKPESYDIVNYWTELQTAISTYRDELTLKFPDTDTIYRYDISKQEFIPQYSICTGEEKGDYEFTHLWIKDRKAFDYFTIAGYYPTLDYIYLVCNKGEEIYTYCFAKKEGTVSKQIRKGKIIERKLPWFSTPHLLLERPFTLKNDLIGGDFTVDYHSYGKYWIDLLDVNSGDCKVSVEELKQYSVKDGEGRDKFIDILKKVNEDSNPILLIATLK